MAQPTWSKMSGRGGAMTTSTVIASDTDLRAFIDEYFKAWEGTDENRILSYTPQPCRWRFRAR